MGETLDAVIAKAREMITRHQYSECDEIIRQALSDYPDNPIPNNLMGLLYVNEGNRQSAIKHFRAALALDAAYQPALINMDIFGTDFSDKVQVFDESDEPTVTED